MSNKKKTKNKALPGAPLKISLKRVKIFDFMRGFAVFFMVLTHTIAFTSTQDSPFMKYFGWFGGFICFTTFIFVSGATGYIAYISRNLPKTRKGRKAFKRLVTLLVAYYALAILAIFLNGLPESSKYECACQTQGGIYVRNVVMALVGVVTFQYIPSYTEYIAPFVFFGASLILFEPVYRFVSKNISLAISIGVLFFTLGNWLYMPKWPVWLGWSKYLFTGASNVHTFPIFQYLILFLYGIWWGRYYLDLLKLSGKKLWQNKKRFLFKGVLTSTIGLFVSFVAFFSSSTGRRFPPSWKFLLTSSIFIHLSLVIHLISLSFGGFRISFGCRKLKEIWLVISTKSLDILIIHLLLLFLYDRFVGFKLSSDLGVFSASLVVIMLCFAVIKLKELIIARNADKQLN